MQNIRLSATAAYELMEKLRDLLDDLEDDDIRDVCIRAGDDIKEPLDEVEVHVNIVSVLHGSKRKSREDPRS